MRDRHGAHWRHCASQAHRDESSGELDVDEPLDRGARIARIAHRDRHPVRGARERSVGVAVAEAPVAHDVRADVAVQQRCAGRGRGDRIDHRVELAVLDLDPFERVFGRITVARHHHRHRLPRVTHPIDRKCVMPHRLLHPGDERPGPRGDLRAGQDDDDLGHRERGGRVEGDDLGMCMRRAQHRGVGGAGALPHVVGEAPAPGEQCRVLHAFHRASDEARKGARGVRGAWRAIGGSGDDWGHGRRKRVGRQPRKRQILAVGLLVSISFITAATVRIGWFGKSSNSRAAETEVVS